MDAPLPWERLLWRGRSVIPRGGQYALTDFRLVRFDSRRPDEIALHDIADVQRGQSVVDRLLRTSSLVISHRRGRRPPFIVPHIRRGAQVAALLELLSGDPRVSMDPESIQAALRWEPVWPHTQRRSSLTVVGVLIILAVAIAAGLHGRAAAIVYAPDDPIYPNGVKRSSAEVVAFMEQEVMPWARQALGPLKGGPSGVTCQTCHGRNPDARQWKMPAVSALPKPDVAARGWETYSAAMDDQMRNAIYGYLAESENQTRAAYMREVVMPGMARLLHRPAYDFTKPYDFNRTQHAFGCYHCHMVKS